MLITGKLDSVKLILLSRCYVLTCICIDTEAMCVHMNIYDILCVYCK